MKKGDPMTISPVCVEWTKRRSLFLCALASVVMAYGWGYRGVVGHEGGAMIPGGMLGLAVCLGSNRLDWQRRAGVAGLCGAVGWSWGGSLSYMEQTLYARSDSLPDVLYGYAMLCLLGALWAGVGGAILGLAFTLPRSGLSRLARPFSAISAAFLAVYLLLYFNPEWRDLLDRYTAEHFDDADWLAATIVVLVSAAYWLVSPKERREAALFLAGGLAWWVGYLALTKIGGLRIAPPYRSEGWGGVAGILVVLFFYLLRERNRAALMLGLYGLVGGGIGFPLAVFLRHPLLQSKSDLASIQWKLAEESFGFFMGLAIALGVRRLLRGGLAPAKEDESPTRLDVFSGFVLLVALMWMNLRRTPMAWINQYHVLPDTPTAGIMPTTWLLLGGFLLTALALYALYLYARNELAIAPSSPYGKGALMLMLMMWVTAVASFMLIFPGARLGGFPLCDATLVSLSAMGTLLILSNQAAAQSAGIPENARIPASHEVWRVGKKYTLVWASVPPLLLLFTGLSMAMQDGPDTSARKRFGEDAYWRKIAQVEGAWEVDGTAETMGAVTPKPLTDAPKRLEFRHDRSVVSTDADGQSEAEVHTWQHADSLLWLQWYNRKKDDPRRASVPLTVTDGKLYVPWPPKDKGAGFLVCHKIGG